MIKLRWLLTAIFLSLSLYDTAAKNSYTVYVPQHVRPGFNITFTVAVLNSDNPVDVSAVFYSSDESLSLRSTNTIPGSSAKIILGSVPVEYQGSTRFTLNVTGTDSVSGEEVFHNSTSDFNYASKSLSVFIQTDKAIYQPRQIIKFRAVCLKPDLRPLTGSVTYQVQDPNDNIVLLESDVALSHGVAGGELSLTKDALPGDWKITFFVLDYKEVLPVTVKLYKLPKFKVEVEAPSFYSPQSEGFTVKLKGTYTFGKPVKGSARLSIVMERQHSYYPFYGGHTSIFGTSPQPNVILKPFPVFNGSMEVFISKSEILSELGWNEYSENKIKVTGFVTEGLTSITFNDTAEVDLKKTNVKLETLYKPITIKPGLAYTAYIKLSEQDGRLLTEEDRLKNELIVELVYTYPAGHRFPDDETTPAPWYSPRREEKLRFDIPVDGIVKLSFDAKDDEFRSLAIRPYTKPLEDNKYDFQWDVNSAVSPSNSFLQITTNETSVNPGSIARITVRTTEAVSSFRILILSRGEILQDVAYVTISNELRHSHSVEFPVTHNMIPGAQVLASYVRADGEIVADYIKLTVSLALENQVTISSSAATVDAGDDVSIRVQTSSANSYVGARAIDQSVLLLKSGNDISRERIATDLNEYSVSNNNDNDNAWRWWFWYPIASGAKDAFEVFKESGITVLTDALLFEKEEDLYLRRHYFLAEAAPMAYDDFAPGPVLTSSASTTSTSSPRSYFPETWLWDEQITWSDGSATFNTTAPDTITSWILSAFSVSDEYGFGLADTSKITVFRKFFITLNLPLKITRGEIIIVQAIVFNYFKTDLDVRLTLSVSDKFELLRPGNEFDLNGPVRQFQIPADDSYSIKFPVRITELGEVPITVSAVSELAGDALTRNVYVRPEGIKQCYSASVLINRGSDFGNANEGSLQVKLPVGIVSGSANVKVFVYGNILGSTMNNLGNLLRTPSGCGEQNMLGFAPDVFVTLYLERAELLDPETKTKAFQHFHDGYMTELKYKHQDGSYSAFGERDDSGSTWLTAFVAKCFIFARKLRPNLVEKRIVDQALQFLVQQQNENGVFNEPGSVIHEDMQGSVSGPLTMTAYVLIALRETPYAMDNTAVQRASDKARSYLEENLNSIRTNKYALALVTYALHVSESSMANEALAAFEQLATTSNGLKYWHQDTTDASSYKESWRPPYYLPPSNDIEMTAYGLLTYVKREDFSSAVPVMKWLASKRNDLGGYSSTQDTVIAIQALSQVAGLLIDRPQNLTIDVAHSHDVQFARSFTIDDSNSVVFNTIQAPPIDGILTVSAEGAGVGVAQLSVCYNIPKDPFANEPFDCSLDVNSANINSALVNFCCRAKPDASNPTGMFLFEVGLPNGFSIDVQDGKSRNPKAQLVELEEETVNVYFDQLVPNHELCANVKLERFADVAASKPAELKAVDYYKPNKRVRRSYSIEALQDTGACSICGTECTGCPAPYLTDWKPWSPCVEFCGDETTERVRECFDPNTNKVTDPSHCEVDHLPTQGKLCPKLPFPCPKVYHGLWFDRRFLRENEIPGSRSYSSSRKCSVRGFYENLMIGIPGLQMKGENTYITCDYKPLLNALKDDHGFTLSILIKPTSLPANEPITFVSMGVDGDNPGFVFEKLWWKNELRFYVNNGNNRYSVRRLPASLLKVGKWNHVILTWNLRKGAKVYINSRSVGRTSKVISSHRYYTNETIAVFNIGRSNFGNKWRRGHLDGSFSSLLYWPKVISKTQRSGLFTFINEITEPTEPLLSPRHLRMMGGSSVRCFDTPVYLSDINAGNATMSQICSPTLSI